MKFILGESGMTEAKDVNWIMDRYNDFSEWVVNKETEPVLKPVGEFFHGLGAALWQWFIENLPDMIGYGAVAAGILIIIGSMTGKGGMMKPLAYFSGALIIAICILGGV